MDYPHIAFPGAAWKSLLALEETVCDFLGGHIDTSLYRHRRNLRIEYEFCFRGNFVSSICCLSQQFARGQICYILSYPLKVYKNYLVGLGNYCQMDLQNANCDLEPKVPFSSLLSPKSLLNIPSLA